MEYSTVSVTTENIIADNRVLGLFNFLEDFARIKGGVPRDSTDLKTLFLAYVVVMNKDSECLPRLGDLVAYAEQKKAKAVVSRVPNGIHCSLARELKKLAEQIERSTPVDPYFLSRKVHLHL